MSAVELLLLDQLPEVGPVTVRRLVERFGSAADALRADDDAFAAVAGRQAARGRRDRSLVASVRQGLRAAERMGARVLCWSDGAYPQPLLQLADPPPVLFLLGRVELLASEPRVTLVGARRSTARARSVSERLAAALGRAGVCVVSGLALGVDGSAHAGALRVRGDTIAVLGAGLDVPYPRFHRPLHDAIARQGLLVSEFLPGTRAAPHHFPRRNRILAALSDRTVVVEAGARSGSLITVDHALDLGRDVWAVPGPIDARTCAGSNRLLVDGARPLVSIEDFVARVTGREPKGTGLHRRAGSDRLRPVDGLGRSAGTVHHDGVGQSDPAGQIDGVARGDDAGQGDLFQEAGGAGSLEARILMALEREDAGVDDLASRFDTPVATILAVLTTLELHGEVERLAGMRFRRAA